MKGVPDSAEDIANGSSTTSLIPRRFSGIDGEELSEMVQISHSFIL